MRHRGPARGSPPAGLRQRRTSRGARRPGGGRWEAGGAGGWGGALAPPSASGSQGACASARARGPSSGGAGASGASARSSKFSTRGGTAPAPARDGLAASAGRSSLPRPRSPLRPPPGSLGRRPALGTLPPVAPRRWLGQRGGMGFLWTGSWIVVLVLHGGPLHAFPKPGGGPGRWPRVPAAPPLRGGPDPTAARRNPFGTQAGPAPPRPARSEPARAESGKTRVTPQAARALGSVGSALETRSRRRRGDLPVRRPCPFGRRFVSLKTARRAGLGLRSEVPGQETV